MLSRRGMVSGIAGVTAALAGCGNRGPGRTSTAVFLSNDTDREHTVTLRLYRLPEDREPGTETTGGGEEPTSTDSGEDGTVTAGTDGEGTATESGATAEIPTSELEQVYVRRETLPPEEGFGVPGEELPGVDLRVRVVTIDGPAGHYDWGRLDELSSIDIRIREESIRFQELD